MVLAVALMVSMSFTSCADEITNHHHHGGTGEWDSEWDVIVVGAGVSGITAAISLMEADSDLRVLLIEQNGLAGQNSRWTTGIAGSLGATAHFNAANFPDFAAFNTVLDANRSGAALGLTPAAITNPDLAGFRDASRMRYPIAERLWHMFHYTESANNFMFNTVRLGLSNSDWTGGGGGAGRRMDDFAHWVRMPPAGVTHSGQMQFFSRAVQLHLDPASGAVLGVRYETLLPTLDLSPTGRFSRTVTGVRNARADFVIVATGSATQNPALVSRFAVAADGVQNFASAVEHYIVRAPYGRNDGQGILMLERAGAALHPAWYVGIPGAAAATFTAHPLLADLPGGLGAAFVARTGTVPGTVSGTNWGNPIIGAALHRSIVVDRHGIRHRAEDALSAAFMEADHFPIWMVLSADAIDRSGEAALLSGGQNLRAALTAAAAGTPPAFGQYMFLPRTRPFSDEVRTGGTLEDLAGAIFGTAGGGAATRTAFVDTVTAYDNAVAAALAGGNWVDPLSVGRSLHDPAVDLNTTWFQKNPGAANVNLRRFDDANGPFWAVRIYPAGSEIAGGVRTNNHQQVLDANGNPIGLGRIYAVGGTSNREFWGQVYGGGMLFSLTTGYIAAHHVLANR